MYPRETIWAAAMRVRSLLLPFVLTVVLSLFAIAAFQRATRSHWWLDVMALIVAGGCALLVGWGAVCAFRKQAATARKPRWYEFRVNAFAVCVCMALAVWWGVRVPAEMGSGPAGAAVDAAQFEKCWREGPVCLISIGDSVSTGFGAGEGLGYFELIRKNRDDV